MPMKQPWKLAVLTALVAILVAPAALAGDTIQAGKVRLSKDFKYSGQVLAKGTYGLRIEPGAEGPFLVLSDSKGQDVVRELAIVQEKKGKVHTPQVAVESMTRDEQMLRISVRAGTKRYLAVLETGS